MKYLTCLLCMFLAGCSAVGARTEHALADRAAADQAYAKGDRAAALREYENFVRNAPEDAVAWTRIGNLHLIADQPEAAIAAYQVALRITPDDVEAMHNLGVIRLRQAQAVMQAESAARPAGDPQKVRLDCDLKRIMSIQTHAGAAGWSCSK